MSRSANPLLWFLFFSHNFTKLLNNVYKKDLRLIQLLIRQFFIIVAKFFQKILLKNYKDHSQINNYSLIIFTESQIYILVSIIYVLISLFS